jgi:hypothetical protein
VEEEEEEEEKMEKDVSVVTWILVHLLHLFLEVELKRKTVILTLLRRHLRLVEEVV